MDKWILSLPTELYTYEILPYVISTCDKCNKKDTFFTIQEMYG